MNSHPHRSYAALTLLFNALFLGLLVLTKGFRQGRDEPVKPMDFFLLSLATYRLARLISYDKVTSWIRSPFVREGEGAATPEEVKEKPAGEGVRLAVSELLTCSWCSGMWAGQLVYFGLRLMPSLARPFVSVLALGASEQLLDALFGLLHWATVRVRRE